MFISEESIKSVVSVLYKYEKQLSDGYDFYCGTETGKEMDEFLSKIAKEIIESVYDSIYGRT